MGWEREGQSEETAGAEGWRQDVSAGFWEPLKGPGNPPCASFLPP